MASKVCPSCLDTRIFLKKAGVGHLTRKKRLQTALYPKEKEVRTKILGLTFIFNPKKIRSQLPSEPWN